MIAAKPSALGASAKTSAASLIVFEVGHMFLSRSIPIAIGTLDALNLLFAGHNVLFAAMAHNHHALERFEYPLALLARGLFDRSRLCDFFHTIR